MTIGQALGAAKNKLPESVAKRAIRGIINENPAFDQAVQAAVAASTASTQADKEDQAVNSVYRANYLFRDEVNWSLRQLLRTR